MSASLKEKASQVHSSAFDKRRGAAGGLMMGMAALVFAAVSANAAPPKAAPAKGWKEEPTSFLGIALDSAFPGPMQACPTRGSGSSRYVDPNDPRMLAAMCVGPLFENSYQIFSAPKLGFDYKLRAFNYGANVGSFELTSSTDNYSAMKDMLVARYGAPTLKSSLPFDTKGGGKFQSEQLTWVGKNVILVLRQFSGDINTSSISLQTNAYLDTQKAKAGEAARSNASKL